MVSLTSLLQRMTRGDKRAESKAYEIAHQELYRIASRLVSGEYQANVKPTELINETYLRQLSRLKAPVRNRNEFFAIAARAMRHVLVDLARERNAQFRGNGVRPVSLEDAHEIRAIVSSPEEMLSLNTHLNRLEKLDPKAFEVFSLRYFLGHTGEAVAELLSRDPHDVRQDWEYAKVWLRDCINQDLNQSARHLAK